MPETVGLEVRPVAQPSVVADIRPVAGHSAAVRLRKVRGLNPVRVRRRLPAEGAAAFPVWAAH